MRTRIKNVNIVTANGIVEHGECVFTNVIEYVGKERKSADRTIDGENGYLAPGFIDLHCHGGGGLEFMDASPSEMKQIADFHLSHGTTSMLATTLAASDEEMLSALNRFAEYQKSNGDGTLVGVHLEGPCLNWAQCGAQNSSYMRSPKTFDLCAWKARYPSILKMSVAPELEGGMELGKIGDSLGVKMSVAHTDGDFNDLKTALENGYTSITHLYSGMKGVTRKNSFRIAGAVEAGLYFDGYTVEVIADGRHLPTELLQLIYKCKGADRICLITDAIRAAGLPNGSETKIGSMKNGLPVVVEDDVAKLLDRQAFAGSAATFDRLYKTMANAIGKDLVALSKMASLTPARSMGWFDRGEIAVGKRADLVVLDEDLNVKKVIVKGEEKCV